MNENCFWYDNLKSKPNKPSVDILWKILPWITIVVGIYLNFRLLHYNQMLSVIISFCVILFGVWLFMIQIVLHPLRPKKNLVIMDELGKTYIVDITSLDFLSAFGIEHYRMIYRGGSVGSQLSAEIKNNLNYHRIMEYIHTHNVVEVLGANPFIAAEELEKVTSIWKGSYYFTISYQVVGNNKKHRARFYNDICNYERLFEHFKVLYNSSDHKEEKNKVLIGTVCILISAILLPITMVLSTHSSSIGLNVTMMIFVFLLFGIGVGRLSSR